MKIIDLRVLRGPNVWTRCRVLEVTLEVATKDAAGQAAVLERAFRPWVNLERRLAVGRAHVMTEPCWQRSGRPLSYNCNRWLGSP